jgi:Zinc-finger double-stranded RNA-binding
MADDNTLARRTWDTAKAEQDYALRLAAEREEAKTKKLGKGKLPPATGSQNSVQARTEAVIKTEELRGKRELVAPITGYGNQGRSAGFYCEVCDLTYKDSFSYLDHINSSQRTCPCRESVLMGRLSQVGDFGEGGEGDGRAG